MHRGKKFALVSTALFSLVAVPAKAANLVQNGTFENSTSNNTSTWPTSTGGIGQIGPIVTLDGWTTECILNCSDGGVGSGGFAFVVNQNADNRISGASYPNQGGGFPSLNSNSQQTNIFVWGPDYGPNPISNGFQGPPNNRTGKFVGIDGDYGRARLKQTINGLDPSKTYTLSFEYAGSQFTDQFQQTTQNWDVSFNGTKVASTPTWVNPNQGFTDWQPFSYSFTPTSSSLDLAFTAIGGQGTGLPPFLLIDNVQILDPTVPPVPPVPPNPAETPGPLPLLGAGMAMGMSRRLRQRLKQSA